MFSQNVIPINSKTLHKKETERYAIINFINNRIYCELNNFCKNEYIDCENKKNENRKSESIQISGNNFFEQRLKNVFSTVVTTNSDVVENGSAFSYVKDKDANTFSVNGAVYSENRLGKFIFDIGVSTKMESDGYKFYAKNSWSNDVTGSFGISRVFHFTNKAKDYKDYISECDSVNQIRWQYVNDTLIPKYNKLYKWGYDPQLLKEPLPQELTKEPGIKQEQRPFEKGIGMFFIDEKDDLLNTFVAATIRINQINDIFKNKFKELPLNSTPYTKPLIDKTTITEKKLESSNLYKGQITVDGQKTASITIDTKNGEKVTLAEIKEPDLKKERLDLIEIRNTAIELLRLRDKEAIGKDQNPVKSYINKKFEKFDSTHDISIGYSIAWLTLKTYLTNSAITIYNENIIDEAIQKKIDNLFKLSTELSANFSYSKKSFHYAKLYSRFNRGSLLDSQILKTNGFNVFAETTTTPTSYLIQNDGGTTIANYTQLNHPVYNMDIGSYYAFLFGPQKTFGFSAQASFNFPFKGAQVEYKSNYTLLLGLLVKAKADAVIVNLSSGFENQYYTTNAWDNFIVKASVGVPFTIFEKKTKK
jgi:hypothetical protein